MTTNPKIKTDIQRLDVGSALVDLWSIDTTIFGGGIYYFTPMTDDGNQPVVFNGITYFPLPVEVEGMEVIGDGRLPRPKLRVANVVLTFVGLLNAHNDAVGAKVTRIRTFQKYIDGHSGADSNAQFPADIFFIEQKLKQNKLMVEWELVSPLDIGGKVLPRLQAISFCCHRYRFYSGGSLNYSSATCPYTGTGYFSESGDATTVDQDKCGKKLSDCELRYPSPTDILPFKGFPMVGQVGRAYL